VCSTASASNEPRLESRPTWSSGDPLALLCAGAARLEGLLAERRGDAKTADERLAAATRQLREIGTPFVLGQVLLEHAELLLAADGEDEATPLLNEATQIFSALRATPVARTRASAAHPNRGMTATNTVGWLERVDAQFRMVA
jgi:hypothetical protein